KDPSIPVSDVAKRFGVSRTTIYNSVGVIKPDREGASI
ncbi:helix-turn-helix domain-containing protein, partial [Salmonella enterica subsp. enterica serovar Derby]|nr:helix-turn-helix domain-containing protein [Salmonella enterica subsp. enterica serovar Derby]